MSVQRKSLGRGLSSVISGGVKKNVSQGVQTQASPQGGKAPSEQDKKTYDVRIASHGLFSEILTEKIVPSPYQARRVFDESEIRSLADSISSEGLLQPLLVRQLKDGTYELLAGERRLRACRMLGLKRVVACVQSASDASAAAKGLIENLQRSDLNPIEEARGISNLMENFHLTQDAVSQRLGKPRSSVANSLRLLKLPDEVQLALKEGLISMGHAKAIAGAPAEQQLRVLKRCIKKGLSVRQVEELVRTLTEAPAKEAQNVEDEEYPESYSRLVEQLENYFSEDISIKRSKNGGGKIVIGFNDDRDIERFIERFSKRP